MPSNYIILYRIGLFSFSVYKCEPESRKNNSVHFPGNYGNWLTIMLHNNHPKTQWLKTIII